MQSPGPRVPVIPLDPILAIDFCLSQNDGVIWRRLRNFPEYLDLIESAQTRLWLPFLPNYRIRNSGEPGLAPQCWSDREAVRAA